MKSHLFIFSFLILVSSCAELTSPRSFVDEMDRESDGFWIAGKDFPVVPGDTGSVSRSREEVVLRTPQTEKQRERSRYRDVVKRQLEEREDNLSESERARYLRDSDFLTTPSERLYYLSLHPSDRGEYLSTKRPAQTRGEGAYYSDSSSVKASSSLRAPASLAGDVSLGMGKEDVKQLWGRPVRVEIAGDPRNQNERWVFYEGGRMKQIYFESGRVEGWSIE